MSFIRSAFIICTLLFAGSVVRADDAPSSDDVAKFLAFFNKVADAAVADKADCPKMAKDMNALIDSNKDVIETIKKAQASGKKMPADTLQKVMDTAKRMARAIAEKCAKDKDVTASLGRFPHGPPQQHK